VAIDLRGDLRQIALFLAAPGIPVRVSSDRTGGRRLLTHAWRHEPALHEVEKDFAIASLVGAVGTPRLELTARSDMTEPMPVVANAHGYAAVALRGSEENRQWTVDQAAQALETIHDEFGLSAVCVGGAADAPLAEDLVRRTRAPVVSLAGSVDLATSIEVIRRAAVMIAVDSGPMHIAAAVGTPLVALFGPGDPRECRPWTENADVVATVAPCGCTGARCDFIRGAGRCMREIDRTMVVEAVRRVVVRSRPKAL
jgi:ADP-heptose:LPS heptosyltransferase